MINPEDIGLLVKGLKDAEPELDKLIGAFLESAGLTADSNYEGALPIAVLFFRYVWPIIKDLISIEKMTLAVLTQAYTYLGGIESDLASIPASVEKFFKGL